MEATRTTTPVILSGAATLTVAAGVTSPPASFPSAGLINSLTDPIEICDLVLATTIQANIPQAPIEILLRAGRHGLTNGLVPLTAISPVPESLGSSSPLLAGGITFGTRVRRWIFPRPMILRPGEGLAGTIGFSGLVTYGQATGTVIVRLAARGRRVPKASVPAITPYPFCTGAWLPNLGVAPQDLTYKNLFPVPFNVRHIIGNFMNGTQNGLGGDVEIIGPGGLSGGARRAVVPNGTRSSLVFDQRRAMSVPFILQPNESLRVTFTTAPTVGTTPAVAINGYREEAA
jgi:hypothetical protein